VYSSSDIRTHCSTVDLASAVPWIDIIGGDGRESWAKAERVPCKDVVIFTRAKEGVR
jgi:hypothetical protein